MFPQFTFYPAATYMKDVYMITQISNALNCTFVCARSAYIWIKVWDRVNNDNHLASFFCKKGSKQ
jgi:hypothetical protein